jgi:hypothetical protein
MLARLCRSIILASAALALASPLATAAQEGTAQAATPEVTLAKPQVFKAAGQNAASIQGAVDAFRAVLGNLNPNVAGSLGSGRREINWDAVPDQFADPNPFPPDFFNVNSPRGAVFSTPGAGFLLSANEVNPTNTPIEFGRLNREYPDEFTVFSPQRLFTALGKNKGSRAARTNVVIVRFFVPGSTTPALTKGFGAVFTDVDRRNSTRIEYFNAKGKLLYKQFVPSLAGHETLSFLGVVFSQSVVARVRITSGNSRIRANDNPPAKDVVVMDDFIYGEPVTP